MAITEDYLFQVKNLKDIFAAIKNAQAPSKFTTKFLYDLGFTGINDRPFTKILRALGFTDEAGVPKQRYYDYLDDERSEAVLAQGVREAYADLFAVNQKANEMTGAAVKGKLKSLLQGKKSDPVLTKMATTFTALCALAKFDQIPQKMEKLQQQDDANQIDEVTTEADNPVPKNKNQLNDLSLKYSINIELPATRDKLIYDAIFRSIREHLL